MLCQPDSCGRHALPAGGADAGANSAPSEHRRQRLHKHFGEQPGLDNPQAGVPPGLRDWGPTCAMGVPPPRVRPKLAYPRSRAGEQSQRLHPGVCNYGQGLRRPQRQVVPLFPAAESHLPTLPDRDVGTVGHYKGASCCQPDVVLQRHAGFGWGSVRTKMPSTRSVILSLSLSLFTYTRHYWRTR